MGKPLARLIKQKKKKEREGGLKNQKWKRKYYNQYQWNTKAHKRLLWENMFNITNQENANQNHNELSFHTCQDGYSKKDTPVYMPIEN